MVYRVVKYLSFWSAKLEEIGKKNVDPFSDAFDIYITNAFDKGDNSEIGNGFSHL